MLDFAQFIAQKIPGVKHNLLGAVPRTVGAGWKAGLQYIRFEPNALRCV